MTRLLGAALLAAGPCAVGFGAAARLDGRVKDLCGMLAGLEAMRRVLDARLAPLDEMLSAAAQATQGRPRAVFVLCGQELARDLRQGFGAVWSGTLEGAPLLLDEEELTVLLGLGGILGKFDADGQCDALREAIGELERQLDAARERRGRLGRVYGAVGVSVGLLLVILLL